MKFVLHALRHVTGVWGKETSWGGDFLRRRDRITAERKRSVQRKWGHIKNERWHKLEETEAGRVAQ